MKLKSLYSFVSLFLLGSAINSHAWLKVGTVFCDSNSNGIIDSGDVPVQSVLVVVTNLEGTFSNANWTTPQGTFVIDLQPMPDGYADFIEPSTLPPGTTFVIPSATLFAVFTNETVTNNFLIENPECMPVPTNNGCSLTGGGTIKSGKGKPLFTFGGAVNPGCNSTSGANWNTIDSAQKLHFNALSTEVVDCGNVPGANGSIEFQGLGTLTGIGGNKADFGIVHFFAHAEDFGKPGKGMDRLYLRVFDGSGNTLLLISADPSNPLDVAPVTISTGNLQVRSCN